MNLNQHVPALKYGAKILPSEVLNLGAELGRGRTFYVMDSSATGYGDFTKDHGPLADGTNPVANTIDGAVNKCTAAYGDVILVTPGYSETISAAAGVDADVQGISILGLGIMDNRPALSFSATASDIDFDADDIRFSNMVLTSTVDSLVFFLDVNSDNVQIDNCWFEGTSAKEAVGFINLATTKDRFVIDSCTFLQSTDPDGTDGNANTGVVYLVDTEDVIVSNCMARDQFETGFIHNKSTAAKGLYVIDCGIYTALSTSVPFELVAGAEGAAERCFGSTEPAADATEAAVFGTLGTKFWISQSTSLGNDSDGGGQGSITGTVAT